MPGELQRGRKCCTHAKKCYCVAQEKEKGAQKRLLALLGSRMPVAVRMTGSAELSPAWPGTCIRKRLRLVLCLFSSVLCCFLWYL